MNKSQTEPCVILIEDIFSRVNALRKLMHRAPIENRAMASRCTLRFNLGRQQKVDFGADKITLSPNDITELENLISDQFNVFMEGELSKLCARPKKQVVRTPLVQPQPVAVIPEKSGFMFRLKRLLIG